MAVHQCRLADKVSMRISLGARLVGENTTKGNLDLGVVSAVHTNEFVGPSLLSDEPTSTEADEGWKELGALRHARVIFGADRSSWRKKVATP